MQRCSLRIASVCVTAIQTTSRRDVQNIYQIFGHKLGFKKINFTVCLSVK